MNNDFVKVRFSQSAIDAILLESEASADENLETGGALLGVTDDDGTISILHALGPGKNAVRTPAKFEKCPIFTVQSIVELRKSTALLNLNITGDWHLHPIMELSGGDTQTLVNVCSAYENYLALVVCGFEERRLRLFTAKDGKPAELEYEVFDDSADVQTEPELIDYDRTRTIVDPVVSKEWNVLVIGAGSGGGVVYLDVIQFGVGNVGIGDGDNLARVNLPRHIGKPHHVGMKKTDIAISEARLINPNVIVKTIDAPLTHETRDAYVDEICQADFVFVCTGDSQSNHLANEICVELKKPASFGGAFERAVGGLSLIYDPERENAPCYNCVFEQAKNLQATSNEALEHLRRDYGYTEEELSAQQGLFLDIGFIAHLQAKMGLTQLARSFSQNMPALPGNLAVWSNEKLTIQWADVKQRHNCAVCNPEGWLAAKLARLEPDAEPIKASKPEADQVPELDSEENPS